MDLKPTLKRVFEVGAWLLLAAFTLRWLDLPAPWIGWFFLATGRSRSDPWPGNQDSNQWDRHWWNSSGPGSQTQGVGS